MVLLEYKINYYDKQYHAPLLVGIKDKRKIPSTTLKYHNYGESPIKKR